MCMAGGGNAAGAARAAEEERQAKIKEGQSAIDSQFAGFDDNFYAKRKEAFLNYAMPQLGSQYRDAQAQAVQSLARRGLLNSSAGARTLAQLTQQRDINLGNIQNQALDFANQERDRVNREKQNLYGLLTASADPGAAANLATNAANTISGRPAFSPIGQLFANSTALAAADQNNVARGRSSIFGRNSGSGSSKSLNIVG